MLSGNTIRAPSLLQVLRRQCLFVCTRVCLGVRQPPSRHTLATMCFLQAVYSWLLKSPILRVYLSRSSSPAGLGNCSCYLQCRTLLLVSLRLLFFAHIITPRIEPWGTMSGSRGTARGCCATAFAEDDGDERRFMTLSESSGTGWWRGRRRCGSFRTHVSLEALEAPMLAYSEALSKS